MTVARTLLILLIKSFLRDVKFPPVVPGELPIKVLTEITD
jgi:hypothetical protein